jgi:Flp pilus assembly protein TadD
VDIFPTVLDALAIEAPRGLDGSTLLPVVSGQHRATPLYFEALSASLNRGWAPLAGVVDGSLKYIDLPIPELYDLSNNPAESNNLVAARSGDVARLRAALEQFRRADRGPVRVAESTETRERLRSLGYLSGTAAPKSRYTEADDPKRLVALDRDSDDMITRYRSGDLGGAIAIGERIVRQRPDMAVTWTHLAFLYSEAGDGRSAVRAIRRALEINPNTPDVVSLFGAYLTEAGDAKEAVARLEPYARAAKPDLDVLIAYGVALASLGRADEALSVFEQARTLDATNGLPSANIGTLHLMKGDSERARAAFNEALATDPSLARAHNGLGVIAAQRGSYEEAARHWRRAVELDPHDYQVLYNLGDILIKLNRTAEAKSYWEGYLREAPQGYEQLDRARVRSWLQRNQTSSRD